MMEKSTEKSQETPKSSLNRKYVNSFISGGFAGIVAKSVIAPFDRIKILFQVPLCQHLSDLIH